MGCPGEDRALGGCGRRLNELRGTPAPSLTEKHILYSSSYGKAHSSPGGVTKNHILDELCEKHDLHMCVHHYADLEKPEDDESFIRR